MNEVASIPRTRGAACGVLLILLGIWGGLAPFVGPYLHFGFTPDTAWRWTSGRLYLSLIPGVAVLLGGLMVLVTRHRGVGFSGGLLGALGGAWFIVGAGLVTDVLKNHSISVGTPLQSANLTASLQDYLERAALFFGIGVIILFVGALAIGRFSMVAARDVAEEEYYGDQPEPFRTPTGAYRTATGQFPSVSETTTANYPPPSGS